MNIIYHLILKFFNEEKFKTIFLIILSLLINFFKINVISYITANIIKYINTKDYVLLNQSTQQQGLAYNLRKLVLSIYLNGV